MNTKFKILRLILKDIFLNKVIKKIYLISAITIIIALGICPVGFHLFDNFWPDVPVIGHSLNFVNGDGWVKGNLDSENNFFNLKKYYKEGILKTDIDANPIFIIIAHLLFWFGGLVLFIYPILLPFILLFVIIIIYCIGYFFIKGIVCSIFSLLQLPDNIKKYITKLKERVK